MPYIHPVSRDPLYYGKRKPDDVGELTYLLYQHCLEYLPEPARYEHYSQVLAALEATKLEFYRRLVAPYEDQKILENGDVT